VVDPKGEVVWIGSLDNLVVLNSSDSSETIRVYSLGDRNEQVQRHVRRDKRSRAVNSGPPLATKTSWSFSNEIYAPVAEWSNATDCKSVKSSVQI
jgi:hypothetical protein